MKLDYEKKYKEAIRENVKKLQKDIDTKQMDLKIRNWSEKYSYNFSVIKEKILKDEIFSCVFIKDPKKQNVYELCAAKFIANLPNVFYFNKKKFMLFISI